jgi:hypothetical protein
MVTAPPPGTRRLLPILVAGVLSLAFAVLSPATPALAGGPDNHPPGDHKPGGRPPVAVNRCVLYANESGFGADCAAGSSTKTAKEILGVEDFAVCRDDSLSVDVSPPSTHDGDIGAWYLETCLKGINPDGTGDFTRTTEVVWFPAGTPVPVLTQNQSDAWSVYRSTYPSPIAQFGPATQPRVLIPTFFWLTASTGATITRTVFDGTRNMLMRARVEGIEVSPGIKDGEETIPCDAPLLPYDHRLGIYNQPSTCSYEYHRSSADKVNDVYQVIVQANWVVEYQDAHGHWNPLGAFPLSQITKTPVDEIQTIVG